MNKAAFTVEDDIRRMQDEVFQLRLQHTVLVEGRSDEYFWEHVLAQVIPQRFKIYSYVNIPAEYTSGKTTLTTYYLPHANRDLIICLDGDYDYLLDNQTLRRPFVFHTYVHSVENFLCFAPSLSNILATGTRRTHARFDFEEFFSKYSESVYDWLICQVYSKQTGRAEPETPPVFASITNPGEDLIILARQVRSQIRQRYLDLEQMPDFQTFIEALTGRGLTSQNAYLFIRGHDLLEKVTLKLLKQVAEPIIQHEFSTLSSQEKAAYLTYQKQHAFVNLLYQNTNISGCPFYQRVMEDVRLAFA